MTWVAIALAAAAGWLAVPGMTPWRGSGGARRWRFPFRLMTRAQVARQRDLRTRLPAVLELLASCLGAGSPLVQAQREVGRLEGGVAGEVLHRVSAEMSLGISAEDSWGAVTTPVWAPIARDIARSAHAGDAMAQSLRFHARTLRDDALAARLAHARAVGVRAVLPLISCYLPAFVLVGVVPIVAGALAGLLGS